MKIHIQSSLRILVFLQLAFIAHQLKAQPVLTPSAQRPGSLLIYNIHTSRVDVPQLQNTRINITNTVYDPVLVHWFFVDSASCTVADTFSCLTGKQTLSFFSSDYDPGVTGFIVALAVDNLGNPRNFNHLIGTEYVKFATGHQANLMAEVAAIEDLASAVAPVAGSGGSLVDLIFDGNGYERLPYGLAVNNIQSRKDNNQTMIVINRIGGSLADKVDNIGTLNGLIYNDIEVGYSYTLRTSGCQFREILSDSLPRTAPPFTTIIPSGRSGWMRIYTTETADNRPQGGATDPRAITGVMINYNPNHLTDSAAYNQGSNLHRLSIAPMTKIRVPVLPSPGC